MCLLNLRHASLRPRSRLRRTIRSCTRVASRGSVSRLPIRSCAIPRLGIVALLAVAGLPWYRLLRLVLLVAGLLIEALILVERSTAWV